MKEKNESEINSVAVSKDIADKTFYDINRKNIQLSEYKSYDSSILSFLVRMKDFKY